MIKENEFKNYLKENGSSGSTISAYIADLKELESFINKPEKDLAFASSDEIKKFFSYLRDQNRSGSTLNRKMVSIRKYFEYLRITSVISENPASKLKVPKVERKEPNFLSIDDMNKLLDQPGTDDIGLRDKALLELAYACGLKVTEICDLNVSDIDLRIGFVSCRSANAKSRIIPMGGPCKMALLKYMKDIRSKFLVDKEDDGALFLNYNGERITRQGIWKIIKLYGKKAGISDNLNPQIIRNSFTAHMIMNGADLKSLQELLGNEDLSTTKLFLSLANSRVMDVYDKTHPRA